MKKTLCFTYVLNKSIHKSFGAFFYFFISNVVNSKLYMILVVVSFLFFKNLEIYFKHFISKIFISKLIFLKNVINKTLVYV